MQHSGFPVLSSPEPTQPRAGWVHILMRILTCGERNASRSASFQPITDIQVKGLVVDLVISEVLPVSDWTVVG